MKIGICGLGFVGSAINSFLKNTTHEVFIYDKYKNINSFNTIIDTDILFICLPTPFCDIISTYDMGEINTTFYQLDKYKYKGIVLIKSTILPNYCFDINNIYTELKIMSNPEFLSAKTAEYDFAHQSHIIIGHTCQSEQYIDIIKKFYIDLFPKAKLSITNSNTSSLTKIACNSFYATKIQFFTEIFLLCNKTNIPYDDVKNLMLSNNWINPMHTNVPGPDNNISYGGACLPKDIMALNCLMKTNDTMNDVINATIYERNKIRN